MNLRHVSRPEYRHRRWRRQHNDLLAGRRWTTSRVPARRPGEEVAIPEEVGTVAFLSHRHEHAVRQLIQMRPEGPLRAAGADPLLMEPVVDRGHTDLIGRHGPKVSGRPGDS